MSFADRVSTIQAELEAAKTEYANLERQLSETSEALKASDEDKAEALARAEQLENDLADAQVKIAELEARIRDLEGAPPPPPPPPPPPQDPPTGEGPKPTAWMLPEATGKGDGSSPMDAAAFGTINALIERVGPGKVIGLNVDKGPWPWAAAQVTLNKGGAAGAPVILAGVHEDGSAARLQIAGTRGDYRHYEDPEWAQGQIEQAGQTLFTLKASHLWFRGLNLSRLKIPFNLAASMDGLGFEDIDLENVCEGWFMTDDPVAVGEPEKCISNSVWRRITADAFEKRIWRIYGTSHHLLIEEFDLDSRRIMGHITVGIAIGNEADAARNDTCNNIIIRKGTIRNCHDTAYEKPWMKPDGTGLNYAPLPGLIKNPDVWAAGATLPGKKFWNGDGITSSRKCHDILLEDLALSGFTDGCVDIKSSATTLRRLQVADSKKNLKVWTSILIEDTVSIAPRKRGGTSGACDLEVVGGQTAADPTIVTLVNSPSVAQGKIIKAAHQNADKFYGAVNVA